jgi:hypothetical protein
VSQRKEVTLREGIVSVLNMDLQPLDDSTTAKMVDVSGWVVTPKAASRSGRLSSGRDLTLVPASSIPDWTHYDPIPNAAVLWQFPAEGGLPGAMRLVRTDRKGRFTMANLPQQAYTVTVEASGFESLRSRIEVRKGMSDLWLVLNRTDSTSPPDTKPASEKYWLNITVIDQYRKPVAAATIDLFARADQVSGRAVKPFRTGQTNANGQYRTQLSPGNYNVRVSGNQLSTASAIVEILSRDMDQQVQVVRSSSPPETKQPLLRVQIVDETKKPVVGATVTIMQGSQVVRSGKTDKGGYYQLNLSSGTYAVKASGKTINPGGTTVKVASTDVTTIVRVTRTSAPPDTQQATVRIQVIDQTRKGVGGATVTVMLGNRQIQSGTTNALGYYQTQLAPGSYSIKAFGTGINPGGTTIQVGTSNVNAQVSVSRSMTPGDTGDSGGKALSYTAQYLPPGRTSWITIGTYPTRNAAEEAVKLAKIPVKSKTRVIPNQRTISRTRGIMPVRP